MWELVKAALQCQLSDSTCCALQTLLQNLKLALDPDTEFSQKNADVFAPPRKVHDSCSRSSLSARS